jgi:hypothetical protein
MNKRRPVIIGPNTPNWAKETDVWINTVDNTLYRYDGSQWDVIGSYGASVSAVGGFTQEQIEDFAAAMLNHANHTNLTASYNDSTGQISLVGASASGGGASLTQEEVQDYAAPLLNHSNHTNITVSYDDDNNRILLTAPASGGSTATPSTRGIVYGTQANTNTAYGNLSGNSITNGTNNVLIGPGAGQNITTASDNIVIGSSSLSSLTTGYNNGSQAANIAIGNNIMAGYNSPNSTGANIGIGRYSLYSLLANEDNVAVGGYALFSTLSSKNTAIGQAAGSDSTNGFNNTFIGQNAQASSASASNSITLGNASISSLRCQVQSITGLSDERDKTNIEPLSVGLDFINSLNPVKFEWNMRDEAKVGEKDFGFIAQQLIQSEDSIDGHDWLQLTLRDNPDKLEATQGRLIPILVKAIQELSAEVEALKSQIA